MDTFQENRRNDGQTVLAKPLCSEHFTADIIFRSKFTLLPRTNLSIGDMSNNRPYKTFFVRNLYTVYFKQCFTVLSKFSSIFFILVFSQINCFFRFTKIKMCRDFQSIFTSMVDAFPSCKDIQSAATETWMQSWRFLLHMTSHLFTVRISMNHSNSILFHFAGWLFHSLQILANSWVAFNYHINNIIIII